MLTLPFADRPEAGRQLAEELARRKLDRNAVVLALARGGVPVGFAVADRLHLPLDVIVARKLGVPWQPELAMGALAGSARVLDDRMAQVLGISAREIAEITVREQAEMQRREELYRGQKPALNLAGKVVILVDDGLATGSTMQAAVRYVRSLGPSRVVVAVPVGARQACAHLLQEADDVVCLASPPDFVAVGLWYKNFDQVGDFEVQKMLNHPAPTAAA
jgi:predicted phosphoribosyltransferase